MRQLEDELSAFDQSTDPGQTRSGIPIPVSAGSGGVVDHKRVNAMSMKDLDVDVGQYCDGGLKCDGYEGSEGKSRGNEIEIKRYVATTCSHANHTSSCMVLAF